jgi:hypothetical protein
MPQWQASSHPIAGLHHLPLIGRFPDVQLQLIHSHSLECTRVPWESLALMMISLTLVNDLHH